MKEYTLICDTVQTEDRRPETEGLGDLETERRNPSNLSTYRLTKRLRDRETEGRRDLETEGRRDSETERLRDGFQRTYQPINQSTYQQRFGP
jgi:hypothetical protein